MDDDAAVADILKALGHPTRLRIVRMLSEGEQCVREMQHELGIPQSTVSQHLRLLRDRGIIRERRERSRHCYRIIDQRVQRVIRCLG